jgi:hypothetical protein
MDRIQSEYAISVVSVRTGANLYIPPRVYILSLFNITIFRSLMLLLIFTHPARYTNHKIDLFC